MTRAELLARYSKDGKALQAMIADAWDRAIEAAAEVADKTESLSRLDYEKLASKQDWRMTRMAEGAMNASRFIGAEIRDLSPDAMRF